ncbi:hypothetical protein ACT3TP_18775, partial [Glutamicibacter sp. AOP38-B1-38]|uniref:hypothetical protein n=1 Tax=Glutamicibacter sp. AOP38-B1-38 TaxID=3457680 RepID=UPI0040345DBF
MEYELKSMAEIKPSRVLPMLGRTWAKGLALASFALIAAGCSTSDTSQSLSVDAVMDVCAKNDCFTVKVPANLSVTSYGTGSNSYKERPVLEEANVPAVKTYG